MALRFSLLADLRCRVAESPVYDERRDELFFVDILSRRLYALKLAGRTLRSWSFEAEVAAIGLAAGQRLVLALRDRLILFDPETGDRKPFAEMGLDPAVARLNDGKVGPDGAFWVSAMDDRPQKGPTASLYRVTPEGEVRAVVAGLTIGNGLAWSADGRTMYLSDTRGPWIDRFAFDPSNGALGGRSRFATLDEAAGRPDGGATDLDGCYWSAGVSAGVLNRFSPDTVLLERHPVPVPAPTMPCFGGPGYRTLFVTSLREGRSPEALARAPQSGGLFMAAAEVAGVPPWRFAAD
ncbi:SMP-30/gluconolactonase/LRE family protein [Propylenella binzhouense]|uniref:SMP-30/gluconolactonase/LRE family protein n=1 Tax=Propylenella binzhouense TaxID=2555902 RepID=A0A964T8S1_9HYPH|nr:SMP-30/gluconolactonase/LRE family protein [Propylenella binzhouense]MYZ49874.1 SMP-30/gluconolactonase/LRE family protein [Propylenella binzhouense]